MLCACIGNNLEFGTVLELFIYAISKRHIFPSKQRNGALIRNFLKFSLRGTSLLAS